MKFYEVTTQFVLTSHLVGYDMCAVSAKVWDALKPDAADEVRGRGREGVRRLHRQVQCAGEGGRRLLQGAGPEVYSPDVAAFRAFAQKKYLDSAMAKDWPKGMLERINAIK